MLRFLKRLRTFKGSIHFVYSEPSRYYGSTVLRGEQLAKIAQKALGQPVHFTSTDYRYKNCTLFITKWALYELRQKGLSRLKAKGNRIILDPIDGPIYPDWLKYADIIVAVSESISEEYKKNFPPNVKVIVIDHNADLRLKQQNWSRKPKKLKTVYFGEHINTIYKPQIAQRVDFLWVDTVHQKDYWLKAAPNYNLHYAVRKKRDVYPNKPFMKGFTAAHCGANILIQASEKEAVRWLGKDYPYLLHGRVTEKKILEMLKYAEKSYGSKEWRRGLRTMERIRKKTSEEAIGKQLVELFTQVQR